MTGLSLNQKKYLSYFLLLFSIIYTFLIISTVLSPGFNRAGDDVIHVAHEYDLEKIIQEQHTIFGWSELYGLGDPLFVYRPPLSYYFPVLFHLLSFKLIPLMFWHKLVLVLAMALYPVAIFYFMRKLKFDYLTSGLAALFTIAPISTFGHTIHAYFNFGLLKQSIAILLTPFALGKLYASIEYKESILLPPILIALIYLAHPYIAYTLFLVVGVYFLIKLFCSSIKQTYPKLIKMFIILVLSMLLTSLYLIPFISSTELEKPGIFNPTSRDVFEQIMFTTSEAVHNIFSGAMFDRGEQEGKTDLYKWNNTNTIRLPIFTIFLLLGLIIAIVKIRDLKNAFLSLNFLFSFLLMISFDDIPILRLIPFYKNYTFLHGVVTLEFFAICLAAIGLLYFIKFIMKLYSRYFNIKQLSYITIFIVITSLALSTVYIDRYRVAKIQIDREYLNIDDTGKIIPPSEKYGINNQFKEITEVLRNEKEPGRAYANPKTSFEFFYMTIFPVLVNRNDIINGAYVTLYGGINRYMLDSYRSELCCNYNLQELNNVRYIFSFKNDQYNLTQIKQNSKLLSENENFFLYKIKGNFSYFSFVNKKPVLVFANKQEWYNSLVKWTGIYKDSKNSENLPYLIKYDNKEEIDPNAFPAILLLTFEKKDTENLKDYLTNGGKIYSYKVIPDIKTEVLNDLSELDTILIKGNSYITELETKNNYNSAIINTDNDKLLYLKKTYYRGWKAYIDGEKVKTFYISPGFNAIFMPKGEHKVEFKFEGHNNYILGIFLSLMTLIVLIIYHFKYGRKQ